MECLRNAKNEISAFFGSSFGFVSTLCITIHKYLKSTLAEK